MKQCIKANISYSDKLDMDLNEINVVLDALIDKREMYMNDTLLVWGHSMGIINRAVWGSNDNNYTLPRIRIRPKTEEEILKEMRSDFNVVGNEISKA